MRKYSTVKRKVEILQKTARIIPCKMHRAWLTLIGQRKVRTARDGVPANIPGGATRRSEQQ